MSFVRHISAVVFIFICSILKGQFYNLPNDYFFSLLTERKLAKKDSSIHTGVKPYIHFFSPKFVHEADSHVVFKYISEDPALDLVFYKHLIGIEPKKENFKLRVDPLLNLQLGRDLVDSTKEKLITNTRGLIASACVGSDVYIETLFAENQSFFPSYLKSYAKATSVVPGQGRHKSFKSTGFDYAFASGFVSYQPVKNLNLQFGHGKHKIGEGYRSLFLSDNAFNYPYARITQQWFKGRLQYTNLYAVLMNLEPATAIPVPNAERLFQKKPAAFQYLSLNATKFLNIGLFQGIIWQTGNSKNKQQLNLMYANPVLFTHAAYYGLNNTNNVLIGADVKLKITNAIQVYGQVMADDLSNAKSTGNGIGYQAGAKWFDALGIKNFMAQLEYNDASESSYNSPLGTTTNQSYSHYNQGLAFTPGSGRELVILGDYKYKRFFGNARYLNQDIQLNKEKLYNTSLFFFNLGYLINPAYNLNVSVGYVYRYQKFYNFSTPNLTTSYLNFSIRTNLYNIYYDF